MQAPSSWLLQNTDLLRAGMRVLDIASGRGRHALPLARAGLEVTAIDRDAKALDDLARTAAEAGAAVVTRALDLERQDGVDLGQAAFDVVLVFNYLHRPLFPSILRALAPGGLLFYETFLTGQAALGHPKNPAFLLEPGELIRRVAPLTVRRHREGAFDGKRVSSVVAQNLHHGLRPTFEDSSTYSTPSSVSGLNSDVLIRTAPCSIAEKDDGRLAKGS
jgi:SAM-dependent methyltransferase